MSGLDEGSLSFLITLVDTFVFSSLLMKIRKRDACLSVFLLSSLFCHKCQPSFSLAKETIVFLNTFFFAYIGVYIPLFFSWFLSPILSSSSWWRIHTKKTYRISREHCECTYWNYVSYVLLLNLTHWDSVKRSALLYVSLFIPALLRTPIAIYNTLSSYRTWPHIIVLCVHGFRFVLLSSLLFYTPGNSMKEKKEHRFWMPHKLRLIFQPHNYCVALKYLP